MLDNLELMDVTLRDGSYAINFQFSEADTYEICKKLDNSGIRYIEIGHGVGLNASDSQKGEALCSDEEYLAAAERAELNALYGMFCIPGVARVDDLELLDRHHASFVRIGTNVNEVSESKDYIEKAKNLGLIVMANYMKSYVATDSEFEKNVRMSKKYGADGIYIVDSAGGMSKQRIKEYYEIIRNVGGVKIGFHGHDNMGMAVANSIYAAELGFDFVDTSLKGMGRSAGNAATELVYANLLKWYSFNKYDLKLLVECGEKYVKPIYVPSNHSALDLYCGISEFHSSYMKYIHKFSSKYQVDPLDLISAYAKVDRVNIDEELMDKIASSLSTISNRTIRYDFIDYFGNEQG